MTVIATAGHVDHGKSSLVRAICGTDPDRLAEEKRRGMTIELGFAHRDLEDGSTLSFVDVPGHADFVRTMVAGAGAADVALLVVDAGEGWMPQTEEHMSILGLLGIRCGTVAVTKSDRVTADRIPDVIEDVRRRLQDSAVRWDAVIPVSVVDGSGINELVAELARTVRESTGNAGDAERARVFIDRVFTLRGQGTVVTGTVDTGCVSAGDRLEVCRTGETVRVRAVQTHGLEVESGLTHTRCALNLSSTDVRSLRRGDALVTPGAWFRSSSFDATFRVLGSSPALRRRGGFSLHVGTDDRMASVRIIGGETIEPGAEGPVRLRFDGFLPLSPGDRFLLRDPGTGTTVGGGTVRDVDPRERLARAMPDGTVGSQLRGRGWVEVAEARRLTGLALEPVAGTWFATEDVAETTRDVLRRRIDDGSLDVALLSGAERALLDLMDVDISHGRSGTDDALESDPVALTVREGRITPPSSAALDRDTVRRLVHAGIIFEHDGIAFHRDVLQELRDDLSRLWSADPAGFSVSQLRAHLLITRKHAVPLAECLDRSGLTRRRGDVRVPGPRW